MQAQLRLAQLALDGGDKPPRYYQILAVNKVMEAIARRQNRLLLVMTTGTGKTFTTFQIMGRCAVVDSDSDGFLCGTGSFILRKSSDMSINLLCYFLDAQIFESICQETQ